VVGGVFRFGHVLILLPGFAPATAHMRQRSASKPPKGRPDVPFA
jgi:hypothetical protein